MESTIGLTIVSAHQARCQTVNNHKGAIEFKIKEIPSKINEAIRMGKTYITIDFSDCLPIVRDEIIRILLGLGYQIRNRKSHIVRFRFNYVEPKSSTYNPFFANS